MRTSGARRHGGGSQDASRRPSHSRSWEMPCAAPEGEKERGPEDAGERDSCRDCAAPGHAEDDPAAACVTAYRTGGVRPLQLPTVNKRHLGSHVAQRLGPAIEPQLSAQQAA
eukprot:3433598-Lingulodinium_polyedra.AAC.1